MKSILAGIATSLALAVASPAAAWGDLGHEVTALIAYKHLKPPVRAKLDALLAGDPDTLTAPDFASRATWADKYRASHGETAEWHFVDIEIDHPDLRQACFGFPALQPGQPASQGPAQDCIVDKIKEFTAELHDPATPAPERLLALKFLIHFIGDLHQPLHAADHHDRGGNCIGLSPPAEGDLSNLHAFWDVATVTAQGQSAQAIADKLNQAITPQEVRSWGAGDPAAWAMETFDVARKVAYQLPSLPTCDDRASITLSPAYVAAADKTAAVQLEKAGIRMAYVINRAL